MSTGSFVKGVASRQVLADQVYEELLSALIDGRLAAGESLNIDALARDFGISPTPIREALARLESTGLVIRAALKGYKVAPLFSAGELSELMEARLVLEPENAFRACGHSTDDFVAELDASIRELSHSAQRNGAETIRPYWLADERFHRLIAEQSGNRFLLSAYTALGGHVQRFRLFGGLLVSDADRAIAEHTEILDAIRRGDAEAARASMARHVENVRNRAIDDTEHLPHS